MQEGYLRKIPEDPITKAADWQAVFAEPDPDRPGEVPGVFDVKSNSGLHVPRRHALQRMVRARRASRRSLVPPRCVLLLALPGCAARTAYRKGQKEARKENWDLAVAHLTEAVQKKPDDIGYKIALENARIRASRAHYDAARKALAAQELDRARRRARDRGEVRRRATSPPPTTSPSCASRIRSATRRSSACADFEAMKDRAQQQRLPLPVLSPRSPVPITLKFNQTSLQNVLDTLAKLAGRQRPLRPGLPRQEGRREPERA